MAPEVPSGTALTAEANDSILFEYRTRGMAVDVEVPVSNNMERVPFRLSQVTATLERAVIETTVTWVVENCKSKRSSLEIESKIGSGLGHLSNNLVQDLTINTPQLFPSQSTEVCITKIFSFAEMNPHVLFAILGGLSQAPRTEWFEKVGIASSGPNR